MARLSEAPRIERLPLANLVLPETHPAAPTVAEAPVFAFLIHHPDEVVPLSV
jgi:hypothetical protein